MTMLVFNDFQLFLLKLTLAVGVLLLHYQPCTAQSENALPPTYSKYEFGAFITLNYPKFSHENPLDFLVSPTGARTRVGLKGFARFYPFKRFYTEYQLHYSPEGGGYGKIRKTNVNYLNSNILIGYSALEKRRVRIDFHVGYCFGKLINARYKDSQTNTNENVSAYFNSWKGASVIGLGVKIKASENYLVNLNIDTFSAKSILKTTPTVFQLVTPSFSIGVSRKFL